MTDYVGLPTMAVVRIREGIRITHLHDIFSRMSGARWHSESGFIMPKFSDLYAQLELSTKVSRHRGGVEYYYPIGHVSQLYWLIDNINDSQRRCSEYSKRRRRRGQESDRRWRDGQDQVVGGARGLSS